MSTTNTSELYELDRVNTEAFLDKFDGTPESARRFEATQKALNDYYAARDRRTPEEKKEAKRIADLRFQWGAFGCD